jgi:D-serine deaminase-like pyridoxal phosphate-dependent protein
VSCIPPPARVGDLVAEVDTPALLLDLEAFEANVALVHGRVLGAGLRLRAHGKAHKCPAIGRRQVEAGAVGLCCQKVGEAEAFVADGIRDVLVSNVIVGAGKAVRLAALAERARVGVCVDSLLQVDQLGSAARAAGTTLEVLIEVDVGGRRCGVVEPTETVALASCIASYAPALRLRGLQAYHGPAQHLRTPEARREAIASAARIAAAHRDALLAAGFTCEEITGGGTGSYPHELGTGLWTEIQAGSYALMDRDYIANQPDAEVRLPAQALEVLCTVITARPAHFVLDAGLKALSTDSGLPAAAEPGWRVRGLSDEHAVLLPEEGARHPVVGEKIRLLPSHCDPTVNLHDWIVAHRNGRVEAVWPISARGALF